MKLPFSVASRIWLLVFALWAGLLSGSFSSVVGTPGVIQALHLKKLLVLKEGQFRQLENEMQHLSEDHERLEKSRIAQEREVRKTLGYAAEDEIIFDFTAGERAALAVQVTQPVAQ